MMRLVVLFSAVLVTVHGVSIEQSTSVSQCRSNSGELPSITYIQGCSTPPCVLHQQEHVAIKTIFRAPRNMASMKTSATAFIRIGAISLPVPYDLQEQAETCNFLVNSQCPIQQGSLVQYALRFYIEPFFPVGTSVDLEFSVADQDRAPVFCLRTAVSIAAPRAALVAEN